MSEVSTRTATESGSFAVRLFVTYSALAGLAMFIGKGLTVLLGGPQQTQTLLTIPPVFLVSTIVLVFGSLALHRASGQVRLERQRTFRVAMVCGLVLGTLFVGLQTYGLWYLLQFGRSGADSQTGAHTFVFVFAVLHGLHFTVAMMFLVYVTLKSFTDRYDHEYYWGVTVCAWFWHILGIVWMAILVIFFFAAQSAQLS